EAQKELHFRATHDALTGVWNRAAILDRLEAELARAQRGEHPLTVVMADVDTFKNINDSYGHQVGDSVLHGIAQRINRTVRVYDAIGRYGGEEFLIVLPGCDTSTGSSLAGRFPEAVRQPGMIEKFPSIPVTCSFG